MVKIKNKSPHSKADRMQIIGLHLFFLFLVITALFVFKYEKTSLENLILARLKSKAKTSALELSISVTSKIGNHFRDLNFLLNDFINANDGHITPNIESLHVFDDFKKFHKGISAINIINAPRTKIIYSTSKYYTNRTIKSIVFNRLRGYSNRYIGTLYYESKNVGWVVPINIPIINIRNKRILGFLGSPFLLSNFRNIASSKFIESELIEANSGKIISSWRNGIWSYSGNNAFNYYGSIKLNVAGYPWIIESGWSKAVFDAFLWKEEMPYFFMTSILIFLFILADIISYSALKRSLRFKNYQKAVIGVQEDILSLKDAESIYKHIVTAIVDKTDAIGSAIMIPDETKKEFHTVAACAKEKEHESAMLKITPSMLAEDNLGNMPASIAYRDKKIFGPVKSMPQSILKEYPAFSKIKSLTAFPIFEIPDSNPVAILGIQSSSRFHFSNDMINIIMQLTNSAGMKIRQISTNDKLIAESEIKNAFLSNTSAGITLATYPDRVFIEANETFLNILGYPNIDALRNNNSREVYPSDEVYSRVGKLASRILDEGKGSEKDIPVVKRDGTTIYADFYGQKLDKLYNGKEQILWTLIDITDRHRLAEDLSYQALYDELTGLPNRRSLLLELDLAMARAIRHKALLAVAVIDLDDFKPVNDIHGHEVGDRVLKILGYRLKSVLRTSDFIARLGGDEFVLIVEEFKDKKALENIFSKIENKITETIALENQIEILTHLSMGVYIFDGESDNKNLLTPDILLRYADRALYESKSNKAERLNYYAFYGETVPHVRNKMQQLLYGGGLRVYYQPIVNNPSMEIAGVEALARLEDDGQIIAPYDFLPVLSENDLLHLSNEVLRKAVQELTEIGESAEKLWISVNVDPKFMSSEYLESLRSILEEHEIEPSRIVIEILETGDFLGRDKALGHIKAIKNYGIKVALDDVGSAYSSLMRLKELPVDKIKLDQFFIRNLEQNPEDLHFVQSILELAEDKKVKLVVEGVETEDILDAISVMGAHQIQGYAIAKPMPCDKLKDFLNSYKAALLKRPVSFLGLYAFKMISYGNVKRLIKQDPYLIDYKNLLESGNCPIKKALSRFGVPAEHPLITLHSDYDNALAKLGEKLKYFNDADWKSMEKINEDFGREILLEYYKRKKS